MAVIEVDGLRKSYGSFEAVHDLSFSVEAGEVLAVLGPNGAGKTTTVEILEGYRQRDAGDVRVLGMDPESGGAELRQRIGIVLQECGISPYLTVTEVLTMHAECYSSPRRVGEVIELVGLQEKQGARVKTLSGGQQRRLDLALGLIGDPELLFLDEPTTGFDPTARRQAWEVVKNLGALGKTILLTTHYMEEAQVLADRVVVIAAGRIVAEGPPESIGGRADAQVRIRFRLPAGLSAAELPIPVATEAGGVLVVETDDATTALARLTNWVLERGHRLEGLSVERPSLEDVYLTLTTPPGSDEG
ncbi:MAG: ABC transporter ATP-binding protein [Actinomycetota bacterium]|nr:ABC transporter ATP-binding protein [Actinomycetota bacterium]